MKRITLSKVIGENGVFVDGDWIESKDQDPNGEVRLIQLADIGDGFFVNKSKRFLTSAKAKELKCTFLKENDVLIARMPDPIGRACIFPKLEMPCVTVVDVCIVRPNPELVYADWLKYFINSSLFRDEINQFITGTTRKRISRGNLEKIRFDLPSLEEQKRIVHELDAADALRKKRKQAMALLDEYLKAVFLEMFGDPVTNSKGWNKEKFGKIGDLDRGISKHRPRNAPELLGGLHPLIQTGDVSNAGIYIVNHSATYSDIGLKQSKKWKSGTFCITIAANIAKTGILTFDACFPDSVVGFIPNDNKTNNEFMHFWMSFFQKILEANAPESAQKNINLRILRDLDVIVPPIQLQNKFANIVKGIEGVRERMSIQADQIESNFSALMQRIFK